MKLLLPLGAVGAVVLLLAATPTGHRALGIGDTSVSGGTKTHHDIALSLLPGTREITIHRASLYPKDDPWQSYLASEQTCPGGERTDLPVATQVQVMLCLIDYARRQRGLSSPTPIALLATTALQKAQEIVRCQYFAHAPCGGSPDDDLRATGFQGEFGENLYIATGRYGAPRVALDGWLNSPEHRENLFRPEWQTQGVAVVQLPRFGEYRNATLWVSHFATP